MSCGLCDPVFQKETEWNEAVTVLLAWGRVLPNDGGVVL